MHAPLVSKDLDYISTANHDQPPRHLGSRFSAEGEFLPEPGNTVVCHLVEGSQTESAIVSTRQRFLDMPEASQLAFTPVSSLHMTVFQGVIESRRALPYWPQTLPLDTPIDAVTDYYRDRLSTFPTLPAFNMRVTGLRPVGMVMKGATAEDDSIVALWRDTFADFSATVIPIMTPMSFISPCPTLSVGLNPSVCRAGRRCSMRNWKTARRSACYTDAPASFL